MEGCQLFWDCPVFSAMDDPAILPWRLLLHGSRLRDPVTPTAHLTTVLDHSSVSSTTLMHFSATDLTLPPLWLNYRDLCTATSAFSSMSHVFLVNHCLIAHSLTFSFHQQDSKPVFHIPNDTAITGTLDSLSLIILTVAIQSFWRTSQSLFQLIFYR